MPHLRGRGAVWSARDPVKVQVAGSNPVGPVSNGPNASSPTLKETALKSAIKKTFFPDGAIRTIQWGPLRGKKFRVSPVTGMAPWYSGTERLHQRMFKKLLRSGDAAIDIGANRGAHTLYLSELVGPDGLIIALEPYPLAYKELEWHLRANNCFNVKPRPLAISDADGEASFLPSESPSQGALSSVLRNQPGQAISVHTGTLDSLVAELGVLHLKLVKIDVEGAESKVLFGAKRVLKDIKPHFVIDLHTPEQDVLVAETLVQFGYRLSRLGGPPILRTNVGWPNPDGVWGSILASHPERR